MVGNPIIDGQAIINRYMKKVHAVEDESGDWYVIPSELVSKFYELDEAIGSENETDSYEAQEKFGQLFGKYMTGGDLNNVQLYADI